MSRPRLQDSKSVAYGLCLATSCSVKCGSRTPGSRFVTGDPVEFGLPMADQNHSGFPQFPGRGEESLSSSDRKRQRG